MVTIGIASIPTRLTSLRLVLDSLYKQADLICVALNGYPQIPKWDYPNVYFELCDNKMGDAEKFRYADRVEGFFLSCDDDLQYPPDYCQKMIAGVEKYGCIVTLHGKVFKDRPVKSYFNSATHYVRCLGNLAADMEVSVPGTGVMCFHTDQFKISLKNFEYPNIADVLVAREAYRQGVKIMALAHKQGELRYLRPPRGTTLWEKADFKLQTDILNSFLK